jgi:hypothetical protein
VLRALSDPEDSPGFALTLAQSEAAENLRRLTADDEAGKWWSATDSDTVIELDEEDGGDDNKLSCSYWNADEDDGATARIEATSGRTAERLRGWPLLV